MPGSRREFLKTASLAGAALTLPALPAPLAAPARHPAFWPDGARLVISVSMQFEAGGQPETGFDSPFPPNLRPGYPDLPARTWFQYGYKEGIPRLLDLWDKYRVPVTSHMVGEAVRHHPALAREIVERGHEAAAHGLNWSPQYAMGYSEEKQFIQAGAELVRAATGTAPVGYNCNWLRRSPNTLTILQELGFRYHIDDLSRDEPFLVPLPGGRFGVLPYTLRCNDIQLLEGRYFSSQDFLRQLQLEFDQLYEEAAHRRRLMSISTHDRISGTPAQVRALGEFLAYAQRRPGVVFMRKDAIMAFAQQDAHTIVDADYQ